MSAKDKSLYDFEVKDNKHQPVKLDNYKGKVRSFFHISFEILKSIRQSEDKSRDRDVYIDKGSNGSQCCFTMWFHSTICWS